MASRNLKNSREAGPCFVNAHPSIAISELKQSTGQKNKKRRERAIEWLMYIKKTADGYMISMEDRLKGSDEEEF